ncbi:alpha/beta fold hydrolase [Microbacterium sp. MAHUQ-60]|uniref:alpha/beta fold hydrolase n=1 Tax=unclassified Microbacterium TaxID=2609290 RepID=UPI0036219A24
MDASAAARLPARGAWAPELPEAAGFEHTMVNLPGLRMHVASVGIGDPVVMLHGFPQHWWEWRSVAPRIAAAGYRVICPDLRGSGWTEAAEPGFTRHVMREDLIALLDELSISEAHVVSHDLGAVVAGQLSYLHPERVRSAVQFAVPPGFMAFSPKLLPAFAHMPRLLMHRAGSGLDWLFGDHYAAKPLTADVLDAYLRVQQRPEVATSVGPLYSGMIIPEVMRLASGHYRRRHLKPPTSAVFGRLDGPFAESTVRRICRGSERLADRFELGFVERAAHFIVDDAPDAVADTVLGWIRQH